MTKKIIIDGYNAVHAIPYLERILNSNTEDARVARGALINLIVKWKGKSRFNDKITIVFDGKDEGINKGECKFGINIIYSSSMEKADGRINSIVCNSENPRDFAVYTNDYKDVGHKCSIYGAEVHDPREFLDNLKLENRTLQNNKTKKEKAEVFLKIRNYHMAEKYFKKLLKKEPKNVNYLINLATAFYKNYKPYEALSSLNKALGIDPVNDKAVSLRRSTEGENKY